MEHRSARVAETGPTADARVVAGVTNFGLM
jgi:hypothetical protein